MKEYEMLRQELLQNYGDIKNYNSVMYTATAAILAFAWEMGEYILCMLPLVVIVPLYLLCESKRNTICRLATYMYVFLEGDEFRWERRHYEFDNNEREHKEKNVKIKNRDWRGFISHYTLVILCALLSIYKCLISCSYSYCGKTIRILIMASIVILCVVIMHENTIDYLKLRGKYIEEWEGIKRTEV